MSATNPGRLWNRSFILCLCNNLFLFTYYYALLTILPIYIMKDLGGTVKEAGLALTLFLVSSIAVRPFSGLIVEKLGKKIAFRGSELLFVVFALSYLFADSMWALLLIRFIHGIWFSVLTTVTVPIANDFIPDHRKGEGMGYFVMSTNLAVVFGPLIALTVLQFTDFKMLFSLLTAVIGLGFIFCLMIPVQQQDKVAFTAETKEKTRLGWHDIIETRAIPIGFVALLTAFAYSSIMSFITAYSESKDLLAYTSLFFIVFAISMIVVRPWVGKIYDRKGASAVIYPSFIFFAIGLVVVSFISNQWLLWLSAIFIGIGYGSLFPCFQTIAIQSVAKQRMGHAISTFFTLFDLGMAIGSVILGLMIAYYGYQLSYLFCAVITVLTLFVYKYTVSASLKQPK
ncbi:MFS transporter [Acinetobacter sp. C_4_1]|uniref:MFS transporter n=1 Tax=unclassified Acinetobacter TaxID=196816 RepID=UPI0021B81756|nr:MULTISPECIES: MFS transporter [unclassified Acinetobacter]MCT8089646.1 MFS transporter [Acinetobacter sp. F_3_1]MCT8099062.1 MFS transporter [Acinetobacter sp. C_3_1]MCT8101879.1 MFS transporter [Acinetobacter sp. C_4_1]MCT8134924.1 MFS transporter [Acinetobacter sp. T_3_1]